MHRSCGNLANAVFAVGTRGNFRQFDGSSWSWMTRGTEFDLSGVFALSPMEVHAGGSNVTVLCFDGSS